MWFAPRGCVVLFLLIPLGWSCTPSPAGKVPGALVATPEALSFAPDKDVELLQLSNPGDSAVSFVATAVAENSGVNWLAVEPPSGSVGATSGVPLIVRVVQRDKLAPGSYAGKISIVSPGLDTLTVEVTMEVGQPVLHVEPADKLDFGASADSKTFTITNAGAGVLSVTVKLPGDWLSTPEALQTSVAPNEPRSFTLTVDRTAVPWYGAGQDEISLTSNGLEDGAHSASIKLLVLVDTDASCDVLNPCTKPGWYCSTSAGGGTCVQAVGLGAPCELPQQCKSGLCEGGTCCSAPCTGDCMSCKMPGSEGFCQPKTNGTPCEDGAFCTVGDSCADGQCSPGKDRDCSELDGDCSQGWCSEDEDTCVAVALDNHCYIDGQCFKAGTWHPDPALQECLRCLPSKATDSWSIIDGACLVDGTCHTVGEPIGADCLVCNPATPDQASPAPDGAGCGDDGDPCTQDACEEGKCSHSATTGGACDDGNPCTAKDVCDTGLCTGTPYACDDSLACTADSCDGKGGCLHVPVPDYCVIDGACIEAMTYQPGSHQCSRCKPAVDSANWTPVADGLACDDGDACTLLDSCQQGVCKSSQSKACDDGLPCTTDACDPGSGKCTNQVLPDWCLVAGTCFFAGTAPSGLEGQCKACDPDKTSAAWTPLPDGAACDDGLFCTVEDKCAVGACTGAPRVCDSTDCGTGICVEEADKCAVDPEKDGSPCVDDGVACTDDACLAGECEHKPVAGFCVIAGACLAAGATQPDNPCQSCDPKVSTSGWSPLPDKTPCDDGLFCTVDEQCLAGQCGKQPKACGGDACNQAVCLEAQKKCVTFPVEPGVACDDGDPCTTDDSCADGVCAGMPKDCSYLAGPDPCILPFCDPDSTPEAGQCKTAPVPDGGSCDDELFCTDSDECLAGKCAGIAKSCPAAPCKSGSCDEELDNCTYVPDPLLKGTPCNDGLACTLQETCLVNGTCGGGKPKTPAACNIELDNADQCRTGVCVEPNGCALQEQPEGTPCILASAETATCQKGTCRVVKCKPGFANCDKQDPNGCEVNTTTNPLHCGGCGLACEAGGKFAHTLYECSSAACKFLGCLPGFADKDSDCQLSGPCTTGCEETSCVPLADGTVEIPDNGLDDDCDGYDLVNSEARGYYVDPSFSFGGACASPGLGTRACPFSDLAWALYQAQEVQDWTDPKVVRKEIYIGAGTYQGAGTVASVTKPVMLLGGYLRTPSGPWTCDIEVNKTKILSTTGAAVTTASTSGWAVLHGMMVGGVSAPIVYGTQYLIIESCDISNNGNAVVVSMASSTKFDISRSSIVAAAELGARGGSKLYANKIHGTISAQYDAGIVIHGNVIVNEANVTIGLGKICDNYSGPSVIIGNTIVTSSLDAVIYVLSKTYISNNLIISTHSKFQVNPMIVCNCAAPSVRAVNHNVFVYDKKYQMILYSDTKFSTSNPVVLNTYSLFPVCWRGGNMAFTLDQDFGVLSMDPASPDYLRPAPGGALIDAGHSLPIVCPDYTSPALTEDLDGNPIPCGDAPEIGAYEYCE